MIINRRTSAAKTGRAADLADVLRTGAEHMESVPPFRALVFSCSYK